MKNRYKTDSWKTDLWESVDFYNKWFMSCAPRTYKSARKGVLDKVLTAFDRLDQLRTINSSVIYKNPEDLEILRACTCPPLAIDRLAGLSHTTRNLVLTLEDGRIPKKKIDSDVLVDIEQLVSIINQLIDYETFPWLNSNEEPAPQAIERSAAVVADRITGSLAEPTIRNSQEARQLQAIDSYLSGKGYRYIKAKEISDFRKIEPGTFTHHLNVPVKMNDRQIHMPIDVVVQPMKNKTEELPLLIECKSAGDFANTNKRRKEEAMKVSQLRKTYGTDLTFVLFLCGYFDASYLGYEASELIDWVWEHRISDFEIFGL